MSEQRQVRFYGTGDADPHALAGQTIAVLGYGNLGRSMALNLRDSGHPVVLGNIADDYRAVAAADEFEPRDIAAAVCDADIVIVLLPDEVIPDSFAQDIRPHLSRGSALCVASGYVLAYGLVDPPADIDVLMLSPRMVGDAVRDLYEDAAGFFSYLSVEQDASGKAWQRLLGLAHGVGSLARGALELPADREAQLDLFVEQTFGAYLGVALQSAFAVGRDAGLPPEALVLELYMSGEMSRTISAFAEKGFFPAVAHHGLTATFGGFLRTLDIDTEAMDDYFRSVLEDITNGGFADRLQQEQAEGYPTLSAIRRVTEKDNPLSEAERRVRVALSLRDVGAEHPGDGGGHSGGDSSGESACESAGDSCGDSGRVDTPPP